MNKVIIKRNKVNKKLKMKKGHWLSHHGMNDLNP